MTSPIDTGRDACPAPARGPVNLRQLLAGLANVAAPDRVVTDLCLDSRAAIPGCLFLAVPGIHNHGAAFIPQAVRSGAAVILWEPSPGIPVPAEAPDAVLIAVPGLKQIAGRIADRFFANPSARIAVAGVTGTNGKTTTAHLIAAAMNSAGVPASYAGTLGYGPVNALLPSAHTTPDCVTVHRRLAERCAAGDRHVAMEVSSHALDQGRVDAVRFDTAVFTNLTRDHLDYHDSHAAYAAAKARLFHTPGLDHAVINGRDSFGGQLVEQVAGRMPVTVYSSTSMVAASPAGRQLFASRIEHDPPGGARGSGIVVHFDGSWGPGVIRSRFIGDFNAENLLAALAVLLGWELSRGEAVAALERSAPPPGRMETVWSAGPLAVVDYAHTPDALSKALRALRQHTSGRLICVFGCGGDRDRGKRPLMGAIAEELADQVVITDDNPRREDPEQIIAAILSGMQRPLAAQVERERGAAIAAALRAAGPADAVLIAGKGHEHCQIVGTEALPFSDRESVLAAMGAREEQRS